MLEVRNTNTVTAFYLSFMVTPVLYGVIAGLLAYTNMPILPSNLSIAVMSIAAISTWSMTTLHWVKVRKVMLKPSKQWLIAASFMQVPMILSFLYFIVSLNLPFGDLS